jgi:D-amino-acid dehydrogenase
MTAENTASVAAQSGGITPENAELSAEYDKGAYRACNRPMTPDGPPILGQAGPDNLYINSGHGHMGFTMACGSSRIVADVIDGRKPEIPIEGVTLTSRP